MLPSPRHSPAVDAQLQDAIQRIGQLPVFDRALRRVRELASDPKSDTSELVAALETDPGLAANVLRSATAACARPVRAQTVRQAVTLVGRVSVGRLALEAAVCRFFELAPGTGGASRGLLHVHASQVAAVAGALAERAGPMPRQRTWPACCTTSASSSCRWPSARRSSTRSPASTPIGAGRAR